MAIKTPLRLGTPSLRQPSLALEQEDFNAPWLLSLIEDLWDTMAHYGGVGIAAPQIGVNRQVMVFGFEHTDRYKNVGSVSRTVLCNPKITIFNPSEAFSYEGCLSFG